MAGGKKNQKLQAQLDATTRHVLEQLVGVRGRSFSDVAYFVIRQWISEHRQELAELGIKIHVSGGELKLTDEMRREQ